MSEERDIIMEKLKVLGESYIAGLPEKLDSIRIAWDEIKGGKGGLENFRLLHRLVHGIAGSAGIFGFLDLSRGARCLEVMLKPLAKGLHPLTLEDSEQIESLISDLRAAVKNVRDDDENF